VTRGRVIVVFGPHITDDAARRALLGRVLERGAHLPIITSDEPRQSEPLQIAHDVLDGFDRPHRAQIVPNRATAIHLALDQARPGDAVLLAGRGDRVTHPARGKGAAYDDRDVAYEWLCGGREPESSRPRFRVIG
jgi:UDP-N-acetylmuramoyl-L-alanyl-D-glutamate--2,6-diaminopimelate ligase